MFCVNFRSYAMHDSPSILMVKSAAYHKNLKSVKEWYSTQHSNWNVINGGRNNWYVWTESQKIALKSTLQIQQYLIRVTKGTVGMYRIYMYMYSTCMLRLY